MSTNANDNIFSGISGLAEINPDKVLISVEEEDLTCGDYLYKVNTIASALRAAGIEPGMKVALILPNSVLWYIIYWGIVKTGALPVPFDPQAGEWELARLMKITQCSFCFATERYRANHIIGNLQKILTQLPELRLVICIDPAMDVDISGITTLTRFLYKYGSTGNNQAPYKPQSTDPLMLACTSGSTGNPKVISVPHTGFGKSQKNMGDYLGFCSSDTMLLGMPLYHQGGFGMGLQMILNGGTVFYQTKFDPEKFLALIEQKKITVLQLTATLAKILLSVPDFGSYDLSGVRMCYFAGEMLPMEIAKVFFEQLGIRVVNVIGSTETATMVIWDSDFDKGVDVNEFKALPFTNYRVLDSNQREVGVGEIGTIHACTDALLYEYFENPEETSLRLSTFENRRWFNTGDLGLRISESRVRFAGRSKRIIKRGSNLVCPEENEAFLLTHPQITAVAVIGEKHELFGEMIVAYIQPEKDCTLSRGDIANFCRGKLAAYKIPDKVVITRTLPHDIGKVQFKYLKKDIKEI